MSSGWRDDSTATLNFSQSPNIDCGKAQWLVTACISLNSTEAVSSQHSHTTSSRGRRSSLTGHEEIGRVGRVGRGYARGYRACRACRRGCNEDATRTLLPWNFSFSTHRPTTNVHVSVTTNAYTSIFKTNILFLSQNDLWNRCLGRVLPLVSDLSWVHEGTDRRTHRHQVVALPLAVRGAPRHKRHQKDRLKVLSDIMQITIF